MKLRIKQTDIITTGWLRQGPHIKDYLGWEVHASKDSEDMIEVMIVKLGGEK